jgi:hydantoinase/carbamoylase family amidase
VTAQLASSLMASRTAQASTRIDRGACARRIARDIKKLSAPPYTSGADSVTRYAFTEPYMLTLGYLADQLNDLGFAVKLDPVGNLIARNCPSRISAVGLGSHCDSVRGGGSYDGALGVLAAIEVARLSYAQGYDLPLQIISWVEEEASGFGQLLLGSRLATGRIDERALRTEVRALDDGQSFFDHAGEAGLEPERASEVSSALENLTAWIELHIEQGRVLEDAGERFGVVEAIAGYIHADIEILGQPDHAGATPMGLRRDAAIVAAQFTLELERLAIEAAGGSVATVGEITLNPGVINIIPGRARLSIDVRAPNDTKVGSIVEKVITAANELALSRGMQAIYRERQRMPSAALDPGVTAAVEKSVQATGTPWRRMMSGAAHDTMCIASHVPSAMLFVPCRDGISHSPSEYASPADAALGVEVLLNAVIELSKPRGSQ